MSLTQLVNDRQFDIIDSIRPTNRQIMDISLTNIKFDYLSVGNPGVDTEWQQLVDEKYIHRRSNVLNYEGITHVCFIGETTGLSQLSSPPAIIMGSGMYRDPSLITNSETILILRAMATTFNWRLNATQNGTVGPNIYISSPSFVLFRWEGRDNAIQLNHELLSMRTFDMGPGPTIFHIVNGTNACIKFKILVVL
jgi:hypothetical protein